MAVSTVLDTNIVLYLLGGRLAQPLPPGEYAVSVITEMELLSFPTLTTSEEATVREFIGSLDLVELSPDVRAIAVRLRKVHRLKLPDAIVAATAIRLGADLFTNDERLSSTPGLRTKSLELKR